MKKIIILFVLTTTISSFSFGQKLLCIKNKENYDHVNCFRYHNLIKYYYDYEIIFCKLDTLENDKFVKNCLIKLSNSYEIFISSDICHEKKDIKVVYFEIFNGESYFFLEEDDRTSCPKFFKKTDKLLKRMAVVN